MKFYICKLCGEMTTEEVINNDVANGGLPYCGCQYIVNSWETSSQSFEPLHLRLLEEWTEIPANIYEMLSKETNTVKRLWMLATVPDSDLI